MEINGIVLVNKPRGISSNAVVNKVKHLLKADKAGHLGTLDVLGEGLLPVTLGKGTKLFDYFLQKDKVYQTVFKFGETSDTLDLEGDITCRNDVKVSLQDLEKVIPSFEGKQEQLPPIYSANKIGGKSAYQLARAGITDIPLKKKAIEIYSIKILNQLAENTFELEVHCSSGTYVRSLCRDIAAKLGTYGIMYSILRTKCGIFDIKDAYSLEEIKKGNFNIISLDKVFDFESAHINEQEFIKISNGMTIATNLSDGKYRLYFEQKFLGIAEVRQNKLKLNLRLF